MSTETYLEHIWVNIPQRTVKILDNEGYDEVINWKFDAEGAEGFYETIVEFNENVRRIYYIPRMNSIITLSCQEVQDNFEFVFSLVERGHTIKIIHDNGVCMMTPLVTKDRGSEINIPDPEEFMLIDPAGVSAYVAESLGEMTAELLT